jgi:iron complex transport system ATP-binding protein
MLVLNHVSAGYGEEDVVRDVSFRVAANENICIIGPNGCGKTTLLKAIAGILPYRGEIILQQKPLRKMKTKDIARRIALLGQTSGVYFSYSVQETVMMARYVHMRDGLWGRPSRQDHEMVERCLLAVDLLNEKDQEISRLSGGQLQRVFLARTLAQEPEIILLDEPTNHLDLRYQAELIHYLQEWRRQAGKSVIGVLHDINLAIRLADRAMLMRDGQVFAAGPTAEVVTRAALRELYQMDVAGFMVESLRSWEGIHGS